VVDVRVDDSREDIVARRVDDGLTVECPRRGDVTDLSVVGCHVRPEPTLFRRDDGSVRDHEVVVVPAGSGRFVVGRAHESSPSSSRIGT
jgi:hypothetical protein